jgi:DNA-binding transcriptional MerR regulator
VFGVSARDYVTIGEVVQRLQGTYPDLSISKVRFLEEEGLIAPERTVGGYRKFSSADLARVEMILRLQKEYFLPLAVIREKLSDFDRGRIPPELARGPIGMTDPLPLVAEEETPLALDEIPAALGVPVSFVRELVEFGLLATTRDEEGIEVIDRSDGQVVHASWDLRRFGVEPRHLRMYETFSEKEAGLFSQILMPAFRHRTPETRQKLAETLNELGTLTDELKGRLLRRALARAFEDHG